MIIYKNTPYSEFLTAVRILNITGEEMEGIINKNASNRLKTIFDVSITGLTFGKFCELFNLSTDFDFLVNAFVLTTGMSEDELNDCLTGDVLRGYIHLKKEMDKIKVMMKNLELPPTEEERKTGADKVKTGTHGIAVWYAQKMGFSDINDVYEKVKFNQIYSVLKIDVDAERIRRRMLDIQKAELNIKK